MQPEPTWSWMPDKHVAIAGDEAELEEEGRALKPGAVARTPPNVKRPPPRFLKKRSSFDVTTCASMSASPSRLLHSAKTTASTGSPASSDTSTKSVAALRS